MAAITERNLDDEIPLEVSESTSFLIHFIKYLLKKWLVILVIVLTAAAIGIVYASLKKTQYKSRLTFALDQGEGGGISAAVNLAAQFGLTIGDGKDVFAGDNILEIMKSRRVIEKALLSLDTFDNKPFTFIEFFLQQQAKKSKPLKIHFPVSQPRSSFNYAQDSLLYECYKSFVKTYVVADKPDKRYNLFEVNVINPNEKFTKDFTDKLVNETNDFYVSISTKKAKQTLDILEARVSSMKGKVDTSIGKRANIRDENLNPAFSLADVPVLKEQTNIQVYSTAYAEMFKDLEIARYQYLKQIPLMQIIDAANYPMEKIKAGKLKMAIIFSMVAFFITVFILWVIRLFKLKNQQEDFLSKKTAASHVQNHGRL